MSPIIDVSKQLLVRDIKQPKITHPASVVMSNPSMIMVRNAFNGSYWLFDYSGVSKEHPAWRLENVPPPKVTHIRYLVWYRGYSGVDCMSFANPEAARLYARNCDERHIKTVEVSIEI